MTQFVGGIYNKIKKHLEYVQMCRALEQLDNKTLEDIGVGIRHNIPNYIRKNY